MDVAETPFYAPVILRGLCYLGGMAVFMATLFWLARAAFGFGNACRLRRTVGIWLVRILVACTLASLCFMAVFAFTGTLSPGAMLPELAILLLLVALYLISIRARPLQWGPILSHELPLELGKVFGVTIVAIAGWGVSLALGWVVFKGTALMGGESWWAVFVIGLLWNAPLVILYTRALARDPKSDLRFHHILWPVLLAYLLIMVPDFIEHLANSDKIHEMMNARMPLQRV